MHRFSHIENWVFDLDNTLYPADCNLFAQIDKRMGAFIAEQLDLDLAEARKIQKQYYFEYGTTLNGLMTCHDMSPDPYLEYVHNIDLSPVQDNPELDTALGALEGPKYVYTNGSTAHAEGVLKKLGIDGHFEDIFDIRAAGFIPKPDQTAYEKFLTHTGIIPSSAVLFEDLERNLIAPHALGMTTVWINNGEMGEKENPNLKHPSSSLEHVHHECSDLTAFLKNLTV